MDPTRRPDDSLAAPQVPLLIAAVLFVAGVVIGFGLGHWVH